MIEKAAEQCSTLDDFVVVSGKFPNTFPKVDSKGNLEQSIISNAPFSVGLLERNFEYLIKQQCSFSRMFFVHDQVKTDREHLAPSNEKIRCIRKKTST